MDESYGTYVDDEYFDNHNYDDTYDDDTDDATDDGTNDDTDDNDHKRDSYTAAGAVAPDAGAAPYVTGPGQAPKGPESSSVLPESPYGYTYIYIYNIILTLPADRPPGRKL